MKYIVKSLKDFVTKETPIFVLMLICICSSVIIIIFSYGFSYQLKQEKEDAKSSDRELMIEFHDESREIVTKGGVMNILQSLNAGMMNHCSISMEGRFQEDKTENPVIDNSTLAVCMDFCIRDGKITVAPIEQKLREYGTLTDGDYFTAEQIENAELVCIAAKQYDADGDTEEDEWQRKYYANKNNVYEIRGKKYICIGHYDTFSVIPWMPVTTVDDDIYIQRITLIFDKPITRNWYNEISKSFREQYGDLTDVPELALEQVDTQRFYSMLLFLTFAIAILSSVVLVCLYKYILLRRQRRMTIFRLCGLSRRKAVWMFFMECLCLSVIMYVVSVMLYVKALLPRLGNLFEYMQQAYRRGLYCKVGAVYLITVLGILLIMIQRFVRREIVSGLKGV